MADLYSAPLLFMGGLGVLSICFLAGSFGMQQGQYLSDLPFTLLYCSFHGSREQAWLLNPKGYLWNRSEHERAFSLVSTAC